MSTESNLSTPPSKRAALTLHCAVPNSTAVFIANWSTINLILGNNSFIENFLLSFPNCDDFQKYSSKF